MVLLRIAIVGIGAGLVLQYLFTCLVHKKYEKDKEQISEELIELLRSKPCQKN